MLPLSFLFPVRHRTLIWQFSRREVLGRYRGSLFGLAWSFITPLLMLGVYTFVFVGVFKARWPGAEAGGGLEFALQIFVGLMVFNLFAEVASRAPRLIVDQPNLVKKVVFPLEILPWISVLSGCFHLLISGVVLLAVATGVRGGLPVTAIALPLVLLPLIPMLLGLCWLLSALGVFIRDVGQMMGMVVNLAMFLSPVFFSVSTLSPALQHHAGLFNNQRQRVKCHPVLLQGEWPRIDALLLYFVLAMGFAWLGGLFFHKTRKGFADVL